MKTTMQSSLPLVLGALVLILGFMLNSYAASSYADAQGTQTVSTAPYVETVKAEAAEGRYLITVPGRLQPRQQLVIVAEIAGKIDYINPKFVTGGRFDTGETLFKIADRDFRASLNAARAAVDSAEASLEQAKLANARQAELIKQEVSSAAARDAAVANLAIAEASYRQAIAQRRQAAENVKRTEIKAPFPALVASETISIDSYVAPGQNLATIIDAREAELVAGLNPSDVAALTATMQQSTEQLKALARANDGSVGSGNLEGYIDQFSPTIDQASRTANIVAVFPDAFKAENAGRIFANDFMTLEIEVKSDAKTWSLPESTIRKGRYIWLVKNNILVKQPVQVLSTTNGIAIVKSDADLLGRQILFTLLPEENDGEKVQNSPTNAASLEKPAKNSDAE